jgi:hypothetical protein
MPKEEGAQISVRIRPSGILRRTIKVQKEGQYENPRQAERSANGRVLKQGRKADGCEAEAREEVVVGS